MMIDNALRKTLLPLVQSRRVLLQVVLMAIIYYGLAKIGGYLAAFNGNGSPVWPATGVAIAAILIWGYHLCPGILLGSFIYEVSSHQLTAVSIPSSLSIAIGNTGCVVIATYLIHRFIGHHYLLNRVRDVSLFVFLAVLLSPIADASFGTTTLCLFGKAPWSAYGIIWWTWWTSTVVGIVVFTPLILAWSQGIEQLKRLLRQRWVEAATLVFLVIAISRIAFGSGYPLEYMMIPLLVWAAFRFGQPVATLFVAIVSIIAIAGTLQGFGSFVRQSQLESLILLQSFLGVISLTCLILLAVISENEQANTHLKLTNVDLQQAKEELAAANEQLEQANETLEEKVRERTAQLAQAYEEITTLNERLKAENLRLGAELDVARQMQQMILPKPEELQSIEGLDIAGFMEPADEVGGDYYDVLHHEGVVTIGIGDVTGHGLESGILMVMTQTAVRTLKEIQEKDPVRFLDTLNRTIYHNVQRMNSEKNLTLALLNYLDGKVSISGQHEETIVVRADGKIERIDTMNLGFPIGLDEEIADFINHILVQLNPGDGVVLYTDGITEAKDINKVQYGIEKLCSVISRNWQHSAQEIKQAVIEDVRRHIGLQKVFDDITLLVLKQK